MVPSVFARRHRSSRGRGASVVSVSFVIRHSRYALLGRQNQLGRYFDPLTREQFVVVADPLPWPLAALRDLADRPEVLAVEGKPCVGDIEHAIGAGRAVEDHSDAPRVAAGLLRVICVLDELLEEPTRVVGRGDLHEGLAAAQDPREFRSAEGGLNDASGARFNR